MLSDDCELPQRPEQTQSFVGPPSKLNVAVDFNALDESGLAMG
jgi:hypothetical protein